MRGISGIIMLISVALGLSGCFKTSHDPAVTMSLEPSSGYSPLTVHFEAHIVGTDDLTYLWEFPEGSTATGRQADYEFTGIGRLPVRLIATDTQGHQTIVDGAVRVLNRLPHAQFTYQPNPAPTHHPVQLDATSSYDPDGEILSYHWDFGDGGTALGILVEHTFETPNVEYRVVLTVTDNAGDSNAMYRDIELIGCDH